MKRNQEVKHIKDNNGKINRLIFFSGFIIFILLNSCEVVSGIFKAGMDFGIFIVIAILIVIVYIIMRLKRNKN